MKDLPEDGQKDAEGFGSLGFPEGEAQAKLKILQVSSTHFNICYKKRTLMIISAQKTYVAGTFHISIH